MLLVEVVESPFVLEVEKVVVVEQVEQRGVPVGLACSLALLSLEVDLDEWLLLLVLAALVQVLVLVLSVVVDLVN